MTDDNNPPSTDGPGTGRWLKRLTQALAGEPRDRSELIQMLREARQRDLLDLDENAMLEGVLKVSEMQVRDIMIPRSHMVVLERDAHPDELLQLIIDSGHSRFPVIGDDRDEVVGVLLAKDLLRFFAERRPNAFDLSECLRPASFIPESKRLNTLLKEFRDSHNHMAIVVDEYGGVAGLLTIEDVLEQIVGDIDDEHDTAEDAPIQRGKDGEFLCPALVRIEDFNEFFGTEFSDEDYDTLGGLLMHEFGRLPRRGESIEFGGFVFKVIRADRRRIESLQVRAPGDKTAIEKAS
ncbi:MAG: CBS domain-containing protein [Gammaproteobacteria bacterium]|nr:CBS domain-containing protein [Gammaproteobacteria bacterium]